MSIPLRRVTFAAAGLLASVALLVGAASAGAHVTVSSANAVQGGYAVLTFRVPTESATASTTKLSVNIPTEHPIASVSIQPHPGWSFTVRQTKLSPPINTDDGPVTQAVSQIDWTADSTSTSIHPGEFDQFNVSAGRRRICPTRPAPAEVTGVATRDTHLRHLTRQAIGTAGSGVDSSEALAAQLAALTQSLDTGLSLGPRLRVLDPT